MLPLRIQIALRMRLLLSRGLARIGLGEHAILLPLAVVIGFVTAAAAVVFHELIQYVRDLLYTRVVTPGILYGSGLPLLILFPALGGLLVGLIARYVIR